MLARDPWCSKRSLTHAVATALSVNADATAEFKAVHDGVLAFAATHLVGCHGVRPLRDLNIVYVPVRVMDDAVAGALRTLRRTTTATNEVSAASLSPSSMPPSTASADDASEMAAAV
jgi:hypothetical protein